MNASKQVVKCLWKLWLHPKKPQSVLMLRQSISWSYKCLFLGRDYQCLRNQPRTRLRVQLWITITWLCIDLDDKQGRENKHLKPRGEREKQFVEIVDGKHQPDLPREAGKAKWEKLSWVHEIFLEHLIFPATPPLKVNPTKTVLFRGALQAENSRVVNCRKPQILSRIS